MPAVTEIECCGIRYGFKEFVEHLNEKHGIKVTNLVDHDHTWKLVDDDMVVKKATLDEALEALEDILTEGANSKQGWLTRYKTDMKMVVVPMDVLSTIYLELTKRIAHSSCDNCGHKGNDITDISLDPCYVCFRANEDCPANNWTPRSEEPEASIFGLDCNVCGYYEARYVEGSVDAFNKLKDCLAKGHQVMNKGMLNETCEGCGAQIRVEDDGSLSLITLGGPACEKCTAMYNELWPKYKHDEDTAHQHEEFDAPPEE